MARGARKPGNPATGCWKMDCPKHGQRNQLAKHFVTSDFHADSWRLASSQVRGKYCALAEQVIEKYREAGFFKSGDSAVPVGTGVPAPAH